MDSGVDKAEEAELYNQVGECVKFVPKGVRAEQGDVRGHDRAVEAQQIAPGVPQLVIFNRPSMLGSTLTHRLIQSNL